MANGTATSAVDLLSNVADDHVVIDGVRLVPSPGHTPHHVSVMIESRGQSAVITGDVMHHPCQIAYPDWVHRTSIRIKLGLRGQT
jgi:glyoxylase-like metal-dependent hydrolase (beta-lactamase superfamily II)